MVYPNHIQNLTRKYILKKGEGFYSYLFKQHSKNITQNLAYTVQISGSTFTNKNLKIQNSKFTETTTAERNF